MRTELKVVGLRETQRALRATSDGTPKAIQTAHKRVAGIVVGAAKRNTQSTELKSRIKAFGTTRAAGIRFLGHKPRGRSRSTDAALQEFGGRAPLFGDREHWYTVKAKKKSGYIIYPAVGRTRQQVMNEYLDVLAEELAKHWN